MFEKYSDLVVVRAAITLSMLAGLIHTSVTGEHFDEGVVYGVFFIITSLAQFLFGAFLLFEAGSAGTLAGRNARRNVLLLWTGILGNLFLIALYFYTRLIGVPVGPHPPGPEPFEAPGVITKITETLLVVSLFELLRRTKRAQADEKESVVNRGPGTVG